MAKTEHGNGRKTDQVIPIPPKGITEIDRFLKTLETDPDYPRKRATIDAYRKSLTLLYRNTGIEIVRNLDTERTNEYKRQLRTRGYRSGPQQIGYLKKTYLKERGMYELALSVKNIKQFPREDPDVLTREEMTGLFQSARDHPGSRNGEEQHAFFLCILSILYGTGLKRSEACSIRIGDIDLDEKVIKIVGKGSKPATILLTPQVIDDIRTYLRYRPKTDDDHLLVSVNLHRPLTGDCITKIVKRLCTYDGIKKRITAHSLRRTFGTHLAEAGCSPYEIKELMRHRKFSTTDLYIKLSRIHLLDKLESGIKPITSKPRIESSGDIPTDLVRRIIDGSIDQDTFKIAMSACRREEVERMASHMDTNKEEPQDPGRCDISVRI